MLTILMGHGNVISMKLRSFFHHPDVSFPVLRRRIVEDFLDMLLWYGDVASSQGRAILWQNCFSSEASYYNAVSRLRKSGVLAGHPDVGVGRILEVSDNTRMKREALLHPDRFWKKQWNGYWSVLVYDIPEKEKVFRDALRRFLQHLRMGCLQKSVWIGSYDIRPNYDDLTQTVQIEFLSYLFEATTVLGRSHQDLVLNAWDFQELALRQRWYLQVCRHNLDAIGPGNLDRTTLENLAREEISAYQVAMERDPLLPQALLPQGYHGQEVFKTHQAFIQALRTQLKRTR